jgi:DinB family protein
MSALGLSLRIALLAAMVATAARAQNPVSDALRGRLAAAQKNFPVSAERMPADKYGFKPTPAHMSFADHMVHMADFNEMMCGLVTGMKAPEHAKVEATSAKAAIVEHLRNSFTFCATVFAALDDASLGNAVTLFGSQSTKANAAIILATDWADHYAVTATYLRLNGLLPPTARS